jgi:serine protease Do
MKKTFLAISIAVLAHPLMAQNLADLFEENKRSVVTIYVTENVSSGSGDPRTFTSNMGLGSGVLVKDDVVLSAAHVVGNAEEIMVQFYDGEAISAKVERMSRVADVALLRLDKPPVNPQAAVVGNSDETRIGDEIFVVGAPMGMPYSLSRGVISGRHSKKDLTSDGKMTEYFQTDASINTGNSGGPMYNYRGEVIGIVSFILTRSGGFEGIGFAATSQVAKDLLLSRSSKYFGVEALILPYELAQILNVPQESGWLVQHVVKDSPAGVSGLKGGYRSIMIDEEEILLGGDIILQVDNIKITGEASVSELRDYLDNVDATVKHRFTVLRSGRIKYLYWISSDIK